MFKVSLPIAQPPFPILSDLYTSFPADSIDFLTVCTWLPPISGTIVAGGKGSGQAAQAGGEVDDWEVIYTDP